MCDYCEKFKDWDRDRDKEHVTQEDMDQLEAFAEHEHEFSEQRRRYNENLDQLRERECRITVDFAEKLRLPQTMTQIGSDNAPTFRCGEWCEAVHSIPRHHPHVRQLVQAFLAPHHAKTKGDILCFAQLLQVLRGWRSIETRGGAPQQNHFIIYERTFGTLSTLERKLPDTAFLLCFTLNPGSEMMASRFFERDPTRCTHICNSNLQFTNIDVKAQTSPPTCRGRAEASPPLSSRMLQHYKKAAAASRS
jgi:hypothetical protein